MIAKHPDMFNGLGKLKGKYKVALSKGATPFCLFTPRRVPLPLLQKVEE